MSPTFFSTLSTFTSSFFHNTTSVIFAFLLGILFIYTLYLHYKLRRFTRGATGSSLETLIRDALTHTKKIEEENTLIKEHAYSLDTRMATALRNAQILRYKALETGGSNQSFSIALLNEQGDGVVLTSLYVRDRINTFAKPIKNYASTYELTEEEVSVIRDAKKAHNTVIGN